jgi:hypothetical protein
MKKTLFQSLGMALTLFLYGYLLSMVGHDHSSHNKGNRMESESGHQHNGHEYGH